MTKIFLDYDAEALEREYLPVHWPDVSLQAAIDEWVERGEAYHQKADVEPDIPYGDTARQCLDFLHPEKPNAPVLIFIHGGYWRSMDKSDFSYLAEGLVDEGVGTIEDTDIGARVGLRWPRGPFQMMNRTLLS